MQQPAQSPREFYRIRAARFGEERAALAARARVLAHARLAAFSAFVVAGLMAELRGSTALAVVAGSAVVLFVALIVWQQRVRRAERWAADLAALNEQGLQRLDRSWERLPVRPPSVSLEGHSYAADLDLFGRVSLSQLLGPVATPFGSRTLDEWLLSPADPATISARQDALRELAGMHELRETLSLHARATRSIRMQHIDSFLHWAESPMAVPAPALLRILSWLLPLVTAALIAAHAAGAITTSLWLLPMTVSLLLYFTIGARARHVFDAAFGREPLFAYYPDMMRAAAAAPLQSPLLATVAARLGTGDVPAHERLHRLQRLMHLADVRSSSIHLPLFVLTLWDVHLLLALQSWQRTAGGNVRDWLAALGELEALSALATLAHDRPDWSFPDVGSNTESVLEADELGHPLIGDDVRVHNDVRVGPPGTFLLVTGSNMSGKSTLLRAIGINAVLAQMGAPVCATRLRMPALDVQTSIRVQDSLARGVSYFMAELERLKQIVDAAEAVRRTDVTQLFLLDEILHGTNTAERRIAATRVIRHLVDTRAIGAATTHDLQLAEEPDLAAAARLVHFTESIEEGPEVPIMRFDYRLREGLATSTNALVLMRIVGLDAEPGQEVGRGGAERNDAGRGTRTPE